MLAITIGGVGRLVHRLPSCVLVTTGLVLLTASFALMPTTGRTASLVLLVAWAILGRIGLGFILPSLNLGSLRALDKQLIPHGASAINFLRMLGGAAGVSLRAIVLEWRVAAHGDSLAILAAWQLRDAPRAAPAGE